MVSDRVNLPVLSQDLLLSVAEELKLPLLQIARRAEASSSAGQVDLLTIKSTADSALRLLDNYVLAVRLASQPDTLDQEAVSVSSVLYDAGQQLAGLAKNYDVDLELNIGGKFNTVQANRKGLQAALVSLGAALIESLPAQSNTQMRLQLATHRCRYGIVAGLYADNKQLSQDALDKGKELMSKSRQPFVGLSHTSGAGIFVADTILQSMNLRLTTSRHHSLYGLATVLQPNHQLQLV